MFANVAACVMRAWNQGFEVEEFRTMLDTNLLLDETDRESGCSAISECFEIPDVNAEKTRSRTGQMDVAGQGCAQGRPHARAVGTHLR